MVLIHLMRFVVLGLTLALRTKLSKIGIVGVFRVMASS